MRLDQAQEILLPWITFKVRELFNNLAQLSNGHALQSLLEGVPPLFTSEFPYLQIYRMAWVRYLRGFHCCGCGSF